MATDGIDLGVYVGTHKTGSRPILYLEMFKLEMSLHLHPK